MNSPILRQLDLPNAFSLLGLAMSFASVVLAFQGQFYAAILLMMYAGLIDLFDGYVARKVERSDLQREVGKQLDSIVDICSFGFAPALFAYAYGVQQPLNLFFLVAFMACAALRLSYFNSTGLSGEGDDQFYTGMPVTYVGLWVPVVFLASLGVDTTAMRLILSLVYPALAIAMVTPIPIKKPKGIWYAIFGALAVGLTAVYGGVLLQP